MTEASLTGKPKRGAVVDTDDIFMAVRRLERSIDIALFWMVLLTSVTWILLGVLAWKVTL